MIPIYPPVWSPRALLERGRTRPSKRRKMERSLEMMRWWLWRTIREKIMREMERRILYGEGTAQPVGLLGRSFVATAGRLDQ